MADVGELHSRVKRLSAREAQVFLLSDRHHSMQDIGDALDLTAAVVSRTRQSIRRKLGVPKGTPVGVFLDEPGVRDVVLDVVEGSAPTGIERRQHHVLRSAIHEVDVALRRVMAKERTLCAMASNAKGRHRQDLINEAAEVSDIAQRLAALREQIIAAARAAGR